MKNRLILLISIFLLSIISSAQAENKLEKEHRISLDEVPMKAQKFIDSLNFTHKVNWYKEHGTLHTTIEAKTKHEGKKYSIEFDSIGQLEDVEITIKCKELNTEVEQIICDYLDSTYEKHSLKKVQIQYVGTEEQIYQWMMGALSADELEVNYELIAKVKKVNEPSQLIEFLFSDKGIVKRKSVIVQKNSDHLSF